MNLQDFQRLAALVTYKPGWVISVNQQPNDRPYLQISVTTDAEISWDMIAKKRVPWTGRKIYLSEHMCDSEFVGTIFGAIKAAEEHEQREWFRFNKRAIYNPHISVHALCEVARYNKNFDVRQNAMTVT